MIAIEAATAGDREAIVGLLDAAGLPLDGLELALPTALVARDGARVVACAAIEPHGASALLRSVAVAPDLRGRGLGRRLVDEAERLAAGCGVDELYLLTETAAVWFGRLGYVARDRATVPAALAASPELAGACPDSAVLLGKTLGTVAGR